MAATPYSLMDRRRFLYSTSSLLGASLVGCGRQADPASDATITIFENGTILPVDAGFTQAEALAIEGNRILAVGSSAAVRAAVGNNITTVDLAGRTLLPGFIEPHMHFALLAGLGHWPDIGAFEYDTAAEALQALREIAASTPEGEWVTARQFDPSLQAGPEMLTTRELDSVSIDKPVFVLNASGHLAYGNSRLLEIAGIDASTPNPPGGEYYRYEDGSPNGAMSQVAYMPVLFQNEAMVESMGSGFVEAGIRVGDEAAALGITTLCDQATGGIGGLQDIEFYQQMMASGQMHARIRASLYSAMAAAWDNSDVAFGDGDAMLRLSGWKIVTDGSNQGFTGRQREPYVGTDNVGLFYVAPDALKEMVLQRGSEGWPLVLHGNGDAGIDSILDAVEAARDAGVDVEALRCRIEHSSILHDEQIARIKELGMSPSFLINHVHYWGHVMRDQVFGPEKVQLLDRCKSVEDAGIPWSMHSDAPVSPLGPLHMMRVAVARDIWREPGNILAPEERVSVEAAIRAVTINAAWQCHSEHEIGSLEPGKLADLVILEQDPRQVEPTSIGDIGISQTWLDGQQVFSG